MSSSKSKQVMFIKEDESDDGFEDSNPQDADKIDLEKGIQEKVKTDSILPTQKSKKQLDRNIGGIMKPEKGRSMWDLTAEEDEDEEDPANIFLEAIKAIAVGTVRQALANQFVHWFQQSAWDEVREVLFASVEGYVTSLDSDLQLSDEELRELLKVKDGDGDNLLQVALYKGAPTDILVRLIDLGGKEVVEAQNDSQQNSLHYACRYDVKVEVVEKLLDGMGQDFILRTDEDNMNALHHACSYLAHVDIVKLLLEQGGNELISAVDKDDFTPLHFACRTGADDNVVQLLLDKGPAGLVSMKTDENWSALHHACANNASANVVKTLVNKGGIELIEMKNDENYTCLYYTCVTNDDSEVLITLLDSLGQEKIQSDEVINALFSACSRGAPAQMIRPFFKGDGIGNLSHRRANNQSILHVACSTKEVKLDTVQMLIKFGGKRLINSQDGSGENVLHYCVKAGVSDEIVEALIEAGDYTGNFIRCRDHHKCNALHCIRSETPLEVIDRLVQGQNALLCFQPDGDEDLPLDNMIHRNSEYPEKQILHIQEIMYEKDKTGITIQNTTLKSIRDLPSEQQAIALRGKYVRTALNHHTIRPLTLYFMMLDIILQLMTIWIFSFEMKRNLDMNKGQMAVVAVCFAWLLIRAFDFVDALQLILLGLAIVSMIVDFSDDFSLYLLILCIGVSWLRFIFVFSNVIYRVKIFVSALESITKRLAPFVFVTVFIVMAFAHMFHAVGPPQEIHCPAGTLEEIQTNDYNAGGWICNLNDSYFQSFAMLLSGDFLFFDKPMGLWSALALIFALVIGIVLLNILIAVINDSFVKVEENSDDVFWLGRLKFVYKVQQISRFLKRSLNLAPEDKENIINIVKVLTEHESLKSKPSRRMFSHWDTRDIDDWIAYDLSCWILLYWFENGTMPKDEIPMLTLKQRVWAFFKVAEWNEIIPPSSGMVKVIAGTHRREELKGIKKFTSQLICGLIFLSLVLASPMIFAVGLVSGGKLFPHELKAFLFGPIDAKKHFESQQKEIQNEIDDLRDEVKKNQAEILALLQEIKKVPVEC